MNEKTEPEILTIYYYIYYIGIDYRRPHGRRKRNGVADGAGCLLLCWATSTTRTSR
jgi:hypothetical protein